MNWATWQSASRCSGGAAPGLKEFWLWIDANYPTLFKNGGIYNCRPVRGSSTMSIHSEGRAIDLMIRPLNGKGDPRGRKLVEVLGEHGKALGIQAIIFDRTIWTAKSPQGRPYKGVHPHYDHLHVEFDKASSKSLTVAKLDQVLGTTTVRLLRWTRPMMRGTDVKFVQQLLDIPADGVFGEQTHKAVKRFQLANGIWADGIVNQATWDALKATRGMIDGLGGT